MPLPLISKFCKLLFSGVFSFSSKFHRPPWADLASPIISCQHERGRSTASRGPAAPVPKASPMFLGLSFQGHACHLEGERKALSGALSGRSSERIVLAPGVRWWSLGLVTVPGASECSLRHANCASVNSQRTNRCPLPRPSQFLETAHGGSLQETRGLVPADQDDVRQVAGSSPNLQGVGSVPQAGAPRPRGRSCVGRPPSGPRPVPGTGPQRRLAPGPPGEEAWPWACPQGGRGGLRRWLPVGDARADPGRMARA